ncbi:endonuclease domain-containing protein [Novosphingobium sp. JCM 18896]|uniref:endonuclease domain-containing protein n=1 Tax=Novosphingobium sp. JCM 18896 TaxID=2989731 RepID=UPI0022227AD0|nr:DUF559 domain-containing protein [Novosphingobium sp. JCM 18896]MCW1427921.1 DUF559 domain-containing protein [Novosphingobium sp. JCM 18896]
MVYSARKLRGKMTPPELALWRYLRGNPNDVKFRRQHPIGPYVVDFCCLAARLVIEIDGIVHDMGNRPAQDDRRRAFIEQHGFRVIRIAAQRVLADAEGTAAAIVALAENPLHRPADGPPPRTGEDW